MNIRNWIIILSIVFVVGRSNGQPYEELTRLTGYRVDAYFSGGAEAKAKQMATRLTDVIVYFDKHLHFAPSVTLLVLSPQDWRKFTKSAVYGMPHYNAPNKTLIVASEDNPFWKSFIPPLAGMPKDYAQLVSQTYATKDGGLSAEPFFDLLVVHELGHAYHGQHGLVMQRGWLSELFCNILLHTYVAEMEPQLLPALTVFPRMVVATTSKSTLKYTTLEEKEAHRGLEPQNNGWYQCRWHMASASIYDAGKLDAIKNLWITLKEQRSRVDDASLTVLLTKVHPSLADVVLKWNDEE
jgi:hypothetical protein